VSQKSKRTIKHLRFELSAGEYSNFWYIAELLGKSKKKDIFLEMMRIVKEQKKV